MTDTASEFRVWVPEAGTKQICSQLREMLLCEVPDFPDFVSDLAWRGGTAARKVIVLSVEAGKHELLMLGPHDMAETEVENAMPAMATAGATENLVRVCDILERYDTDEEIPLVVKADQLHAIHLVQLP